MVANVPGYTSHSFFTLTLNSRGDLFTLSDGRIYCLRASSQWLEWYAGTPCAKIADGNRYASRFCNLDVLEANDDCGLIWISSSFAHAIRIIIGSEVVTIAGRIGEKGYRDGPSTFARFDSPTSIKRLFSQPSLMVSEDKRLRIIDSRTHHVSTLKFDGTSIPDASGFKLYDSWTAGYQPPQGTPEYMRVHSSDDDLKCIDLANRKLVESGVAVPLGHFFPYAIYFTISNPRGHAAISSTNTGDRTTLKESLIVLTNLRVKRQPIFIPHTNTIFKWSADLGLLLVLGDYIQPPPPPPTIPRRLAKNWQKYLPDPIDFSSLIGSPIIGDIPFEFKKSGRIINLHSRVLKLNKGLKNTYKAVISSLETSNLPERSIEAFINYLYFKRISIDDDTDIKSLSIELGHVAWLCKEHGVEPSKVLFDLYSLILPRITNDDLIACLIECWSSPLMQWTKTDPFITLLASHLRYSPSGPRSFTAAVEDSDLPAKRIVPLMSLLTVENPPVPISEIINFACINRGPKRLAIPWQLTDDPSSLLRHPSDFAFGLSDSDKWCVIPSEYVWPQWSWFRRLVTSGMEESKTRIVRFNEPLKQSTLELLVSCLTGCESWDIKCPDAHDALAKAKELELVDDQGLPSSFSHRFINTLLSVRFLPTRKNNRMDQLNAYYELGFTHKVDDLMDHILMKDHASDLGDVLKALSPELLFEFQQHLDCKEE